MATFEHIDPDDSALAGVKLRIGCWLGQRLVLVGLVERNANTGCAVGSDYLLLPGSLNHSLG